MLIEADLPSDPQALRDMLAATMAELAVLRATEEERQAQIADLRADRAAGRAEIVRLNAVNDHAEAELVRLHDIIAALRRHRFGTRSEKLDDEQLEMAFEDTETALGLVAASLDAAVATPREPRRRKTNRGRLPAHLERVERVVDIENKACGCCGGALHVIGEDVAERLDVVPATFRVLVTRRPRYGCRGCEAAPVQAPAPAHIIDGGLPTEALIAHVLVSKYADHLPLYRQAQIYARQGVELDRSTLADWTGRAAWWLGMSASAVLSSKAIQQFRPRYLTMVGICAGRSTEVSLGDLIAADPTFDWGSGKIQAKEGAPRFLPDPHQLDLDPELSKRPVCPALRVT